MVQESGIHEAGFTTIFDLSAEDTSRDAKKFQPLLESRGSIRSRTNRVSWIRWIGLVIFTVIEKPGSEETIVTETRVNHNDLADWR